MMAFFSVLFLHSIRVIFPLLMLPFLIITMILLCSKKKKAKPANATTIKAKRPPPNTRDDEPRKEGVGVGKDYQTLGNLDADIFLKEQNKKGATQKTVSKTSVISKEKTKTKGGDDKKDSKDKQDDKKEEAAKDGGKSAAKTAMVKTQQALTVPPNTKIGELTADKKDDKKENEKPKPSGNEAEKPKETAADQGGEDYESLDNLEKPK